MSTDLSPENENYIAQQIVAGNFANRQEAIDASVALLRKRSELIERIAEGRRQLDAGMFTDFDDQSLAKLFQQLKLNAANGGATS